MNIKKILLVLFILISFGVSAQPADMSLIPYRQGNLWGYASPSKEIIIKPTFAEANLFYAGLASVKKGDKFGYINRTGKLVIPYKFYVAKHFRYGYFDNPKKHKTDTVLFAGAALKKDGYERCINTKGIVMPKCPAINENSQPVDSSSQKVTTEKIYGDMKANGDLYDKIYDDYTSTNGSMDKNYIAIKNNQYGVFNNKFEVVIPFEYTSIKKLTVNSTDYLLVEKNGMQGVLNPNGMPLIAVENSGVQYIKTVGNKDNFIVLKNGEASVVDANKTTVFSGNYCNISYDKLNGYVLSKSDGMQGYYFENTNTLVQPKFTKVVALPSSNYIWVTTTNGKNGLISNTGVEFFED